MKIKYTQFGAHGTVPLNKGKTNQNVTDCGSLGVFLLKLKEIRSVMADKLRIQVRDWQKQSGVCR